MGFITISATAGFVALAVTAMAAMTAAAQSVAPEKTAPATVPADLPTWAYPPAHSETVAGSSRRFVDVFIQDHSHAVDWFPDQHPTMPEVVAGGVEHEACGYCHLPTGNGRPENSTLSGLPEDYILRQLADFRSGARANAPHMGSGQMNNMARITSDADIAAAAKYFSSLKFVKHVTVVETADVPHLTPDSVYFFDKDGPREPIGQRIVEGPDVAEQYDLRDPNAHYTAYVPVGSLARGAALAQGAGGTPACQTCHGAGLKGGPIGPPLAGHYATPTFRQLYNFKSGYRHGAMAGVMQPIADKLSIDDMIALSAYVASLDP